MKTLRQMIRERGLSQTKVSAALGVSNSFISKMVHREQSIPVHFVRKLAELLGVSVWATAPAAYKPKSPQNKFRYTSEYNYALKRRINYKYDNQTLECLGYRIPNNRGLNGEWIQEKTFSFAI